MKNADIRNLIKKHRIHNYEIAQKLGVSEFTFCRWLRTELSEEKQKQVLDAISFFIRGENNG